MALLLDTPENRVLLSGEVRRWLQRTRANRQLLNVVNARWEVLERGMFGAVLRAQVVVDSAGWTGRI